MCFQGECHTAEAHSTGSMEGSFKGLTAFCKMRKPVVAAFKAVAHSERKHQLQRRLACMWRRRLGLSRMRCTLLLSSG